MKERSKREGGKECEGQAEEEKQQQSDNRDGNIETFCHPVTRLDGQLSLTGAGQWGVEGVVR